jgi:purine nucleosidase
MAEVWFQHTPKITFHDPLAATVLFDETICTLERGNVSVWTNDDPLSGMTRWSKDANGPHEIAVAVDTQRFFERYFEVTGGAAV